MGWIKDRNVEVLAGEARAAADDGLTVFATVLHSFAVATPGDVRARLEWARRIAAIEAEGWRLEHWAVDRDAKGNPEAFPVFRRL